MFVDFGSWGEEQFFEKYGVTAPQMAMLARAGLVIPSLYYFDSYKRAIEQNPSDHPSYEHYDCRHLGVLYESDETGCRIASIRRRALFKELDMNENTDPEKWEPLFGNALRSIPEESLKLLTGDSTADGVLVKYSTELEYIRVLGGEDSETKAWYQQLENRRDPLTVEELREYHRLLNGYKSKHASSITAAYGGVYNLSLQNYYNLCHVQDPNNSSVLYAYPNRFGSDDKNLNYDLVRQGYKDSLELLVRLRLDEFVRAEQVHKASILSKPSDPQIEDYISFLKENTPLRKSVAEIIDKIRTSLTEEEKIASWHEQFSAIQRIYKELEKYRQRRERFEKWSETTKDIVSTSIGYFGLGYSLVAVGIGSWIQSFERKRFDEHEKQLQPKMQLIELLENFKQL